MGLALPTALFSTLSGKIAEAASAFAFASAPVIRSAAERSVTFVAAPAFAGYLNPSPTSIKIHVLEAGQQRVNRNVFHLQESIFAFQVDFAAGISADPCCIANVA